MTTTRDCLHWYKSSNALDEAKLHETCINVVCQLNLSYAVRPLSSFLVFIAFSIDGSAHGFSQFSRTIE
jgi:hypothetical protein